MNFIRSSSSKRESWFAAMCVLSVTACVAPRTDIPRIKAQPDVMVESAGRFQKQYVLYPGDQIEITVRRAPEASRTVTIRPDGYISLPLVGEIKAAGLTTDQLRQQTTALFAQRLIEPEVTVIATQVRQPTVFVAGDVNNNNAVVPLREAPTAMEAISRAGGLRRTAAARDVAVIRLNPDGFLEAMFVSPQGHGQSAPILALQGMLLQPDDIIFVPENGRSQIARILDDFVNRPLSGLNAAVGIYVNYRLIQALNKQ